MIHLPFPQIVVDIQLHIPSQIQFHIINKNDILELTVNNLVFVLRVDFLLYIIFPLIKLDNINMTIDTMLK